MLVLTLINANTIDVSDKSILVLETLRGEKRELSTLDNVNSKY